MAGIDGYDVAFQSAGRTPEPWIGPELNATIRERAAAGVRGVLVVPVGFVSDHTEILFDLDVQAAATASACGVQFRRTPSLNDSVEFISLLEELVQERL
jgi:ferrochelatase